jgi:DNA-cytosine methyltransferase
MAPNPRRVTLTAPNPRRLTLTQMGFRKHAANEFDASNDRDETMDETMPFIDLQDSGEANQPLVVDFDSEAEDLEEAKLTNQPLVIDLYSEVEDLEEAELIAFGTQLTQEYDYDTVFLAAEKSKLEEQSKPQSVSSPQRKRPRINAYMPAKADVALKDQYLIKKDSTRTWNLPGRLFKQGETFALLGDKGIYVTIDTVAVRKDSKYGLQKEVFSGNDGVTVKLACTFIGEKESKRLLRAKSWLERNPKHPDKARYVNRSKLFPQGSIPLKALVLKLENLTERPKPALAYNCGQKDTKSVGLDLAYYRSDLSYAVRELLHKPNMLDLFAGCGGMGQGFKLAGFHVKYMVEKDNSAVATLRCNHLLDALLGEEAIIFDEDVDTFLQKVVDKDPAYPQMGDVDHVHASPPCQGFSAANRKGGQNDKTNNEMTKRFTKAVEIFRPRTASMENVTGILLGKNVAYLRWVVAELMLLGYQVRVMILNAAEFGDPQARNRVILFATQNAYKLPDAPKPTHGEKRENAFVTVKDVLHDLEHVKPAKGSGRVMLPNRKIVLDHKEEGTDRLEMETIDANKPALTVRKGNCIHSLRSGNKGRATAKGIHASKRLGQAKGRSTDRTSNIQGSIKKNWLEAHE